MDGLPFDADGGTPGALDAILQKIKDLQAADVEAIKRRVDTLP